MHQKYSGNILHKLTSEKNVPLRTKKYIQCNLDLVIHTKFSDNLLFSDCFTTTIFQFTTYIKSFDSVTLCDLVKVFVETKSITKSRLHCIRIQFSTHRPSFATFEPNIQYFVSALLHLDQRCHFTFIYLPSTYFTCIYAIRLKNCSTCFYDRHDER